MPAFSIGSITFPTNKAAMAEVRRILHSSELDAPLQGDAGALISELYGQHPRREGKPVSFCVKFHAYHGSMTRGFYATMANGQSSAFSYIPCLSPTKDAPSLMATMRAAIMLSQREALLAAYGGRAIIPCRSCNAGVEFKDAQVHHLAPKFRDILDAFVGLVGYPEIGHSDLLGDDFTDPKLKRRWVMFHDAVAHRVVLCAKCNAADEREETLAIAEG